MRSKRMIPAVLAGATFLSSCTGEQAPAPVIQCEEIDINKLAENPIRTLGAAIRRCYDIVPETHRKFEDPAHPKDSGEYVLTVRLPVKNGGEVRLEAWSDSTQNAPVDEFANKTTAIAAGIYSKPKEQTAPPEYLLQGVGISNAQDPLFARWSDNDPAKGPLHMYVAKDRPNGKPRVSFSASNARSVETPLGVEDPRVVDCARSHIIQQTGMLVSSATFDAPVLPRLDVPELSGKCNQL